MVFLKRNANEFEKKLGLTLSKINPELKNELISRKEYVLFKQFSKIFGHFLAKNDQP